MEITLLAILAAGCAYHLYREESWKKERKQYRNMVMAKSLAEAEYYENQYKKELADIRKYNKEIDKIRLKAVDEEIPYDKEVANALERFDSDWGEEEVDIEKIKNLEKELEMELADESERELAGN